MVSMSVFQTEDGSSNLLIDSNTSVAQAGRTLRVERRNGISKMSTSTILGRKRQSLNRQESAK